MTNKLTKRFVAIALCTTSLLLLVQCGKDLWEKVSYEACVLRYSEIRDIDAFRCKRNGLNSFSITFRIKEARTCKFNDSGANKELFDSLRTVRNDVYHVSNARVTRNGDLLPIPSFNHLAFPEITSIDVITINEFDGSHPVGSSIKDLVTIGAVWGNADPNKCGPNKDVKASAVDGSKKTYLESYLTTLNVSKLPDDYDSQHAFRVIITTADGKTYSSTVTVVRIEYSSDDDDD